MLAAAAKSLQSSPTLCDPIDGSPSGSPVPGILKARTLEWVAISFSNAWKWKVKVKLLSCDWLLATPWAAVHQAPPSMGFSRQEYWSGMPLPSPKTRFIFFSHLVVSDSLRPVDCSPPSFSVHGILQARILERVAISFSRGSSRPRDRTQVSHIAGRRFNLCTTRETRLASLKCWILSIVNFYFYFFSIREGGNTEMSVRL